MSDARQNVRVAEKAQRGVGMHGTLRRNAAKPAERAAPGRPASAAGIADNPHATSVPSHGPAGPSARVPLLKSPIRSP